MNRNNNLSSSSSSSSWNNNNNNNIKSNNKNSRVRAGSWDLEENINKQNNDSNTPNNWENYDNTTTNTTNNNNNNNNVNSMGNNIVPSEMKGRDPSMDLDFGLDLKKFGLQENSENNIIDTNKIISNNVNRDPAINICSLLFDPVEGCEMRPYVSLTESNGNTYAIPPESLNDERVGFRWYRGSKRVCLNSSSNIPNCNNSASLQCLTCVKLRVPNHLTYFCSDRCLLQSWPQHKLIHSKYEQQLLLLEPNTFQQSKIWNYNGKYYSPFSSFLFSFGVLTLSISLNMFPFKLNE